MHQGVPFDSHNWAVLYKSLMKRHGSNNVSVLLGNGDGTFQAAVNFVAGTYPSSVAVGDFNGDRKPDLAVADFEGVSILINTSGPRARLLLQ